MKVAGMKFQAEKKEAPPKEPCLYDENLLARTVGIARHHLTEHRYKHLQPVTQWDVVGGHVLLSESGVLQLLQVLGIPLSLEPKAGALSRNEVLQACLQKTAPEPGEIRVRIFAHRGTNTEIVNGFNLTSGKGETVVVLVGDNANFTAGMECIAKPVSGMGENVYTLAEARPREKGRW